MKKYIILIALILAYTLTSGQVLAPKIIAAVGNYFVTQKYTLIWTLGETVSETFLKGKDQVTWELQQSYLSKISRLPIQSLAAKYSIKVSPDTTRSYFIVTINAHQGQGLIKMMLYDMFDIKVDETMPGPVLDMKKINVSQFSYDRFQLIISDDENHFLLHSTIH